jgi:hypothetical protein
MQRMVAIVRSVEHAFVLMFKLLFLATGFLSFFVVRDATKDISGGSADKVAI